VDSQTKVRVLSKSIRKMLNQKKLPYQIKLNLVYLKQAKFSKARV